MSTRREALALGAGGALLALFGAPVAVEAAPAIPAASPPPSWLVGTPGEYNWVRIRAATYEAAIEAFAADYDIEGHEEKPAKGFCECDRCSVEIEANRIPQWDALDDPSPADWLRAGWGHSCSRCHDEVDAEYGTAIGDEAVCDFCLTADEQAAITEARAPRSTSGRA